MKKTILTITILLLYVLINGLNTANVYADRNEKVVVLLYHHLLQDSDNKNKNNGAVVSVENFEQQMKYLYDNGYETISIKELNRYLKHKTSLPKKSVLITFDDGYESNYVYAYPILKAYHFKASIFMITGLITDKSQGFNPDKLSFMSKEEMVESRDIFEFACHTNNLHRLEPGGKSALVALGETEVIKDLDMSKQWVDTKFFAYPYGQYSKEVEGILKKQGVELAFTVKKGAIDRKCNRFELNRVPIYYSTSILDFIKILEEYKNEEYMNQEYRN